MEKKKLILLLLSCAVITEAHAAYQGHVYVDSNRNGIYDKGEKVLKGIRDYAANENISFIIHTGDICYEKKIGRAHV